MATKTDLQITALTDRGMERDHNEDYHGYIPDLESAEWVFFDSREVKGLSEKGSLLIVADGMGGTNAGEVASKMAVESVKTFIQQQIAQAMPEKEAAAKSLLIESVKAAQKELVDHEKQFPETEGMGTTLVVAWIIKNKMFITWVGDSRLYLINQNGLIQLSHDHSYVQELVDTGKITAEQAFYHPQSNIITQSLGDAKRPPHPGFTTYNIQTGDTILICSDGLNGMVTDTNIEHFTRGNPILADAAKALIDEANKAGGHDNITVLLASITSVDSPLPVEQTPVVQPDKQAPTSDDSNGTPVTLPKKSHLRTKILLIAIIGILLGFLAWQNRHAIHGLFKGDQANSIKKGDTLKPKGKLAPGSNEKKDNKSEVQQKMPETKPEKVEAEKKQTNTGDGVDKQLWKKAKTENTKAAYLKYLNSIKNGAFSDSAKAKIKAIDEKYKPALDALKKVKDACKPIKEDDFSTAYKKELDNCIKKAEAGTLVKENIIELWKTKNKLNGNEAGIPELKKAVKNLFPGFDPDLNPK